MDWSSIASTLVDTITAALPAFAAVIGLSIGVPLAWKVVKRVLH